MSFWDIVWFIVITFAFVAYLMVVFAIITDLFRDSETSGWVKALWIVGLIFLPLIVACVYLIARGPKMAERTARSAEAMQRAQDEHIKEVVGRPTPTDQIAQARAMLDAGTISRSEFDALKAKALA